MSSQTNPDHSSDVLAEGTRRPEPSRRSVLYGAGIAGAGLAATAIAGTLAAPAAAAPVSAALRAHPGQAARVPSPAELVIVHIRDLRSGEMEVFAGEATARLRDPGLAARIAHAVG